MPPTVEQRFQVGFGMKPDDEPGLLLDEAGLVWLVHPDGTRTDLTDLVIAGGIPQGGPLTLDLAAAGHKITGLADPAGAQDAATKAYVDSLVATSFPPPWWTLDNGAETIDFGQTRIYGGNGAVVISGIGGIDSHGTITVRDGQDVLIDHAVGAFIAAAGGFSAQMFSDRIYMENPGATETLLLTPGNVRTPYAPSGPSGGITVGTGNAEDDASGNITIQTGDTNSVLNPAGTVVIRGGSSLATAQQGGNVSIVGGAGAGIGGDIDISAGVGPALGRVLIGKLSGNVEIGFGPGTVDIDGFFKLSDALRAVTGIVARENLSVPDGDLAASQYDTYLVDTNGAAKFGVKGKTADGTVVSTEIPMAHTTVLAFLAGEGVVNDGEAVHWNEATGTVEGHARVEGAQAAVADLNLGALTLLTDAITAIGTIQSKVNTLLGELRTSGLLAT